MFQIQCQACDSPVTCLTLIETYEISQQLEKLRSQLNSLSITEFQELTFYQSKRNAKQQGQDYKGTSK